MLWIPEPRFRLGDAVRTLVGTPRAGWIRQRDWHFKQERLYYFIEAPGVNVPRRRHTRRYWEDELKLI